MFSTQRTSTYPCPLAPPRTNITLVWTPDAIFPAGSNQIILADFQPIVEIARPCRVVLGRRRG